MDNKVRCPSCNSEYIYWEERTVNYHKAVYDSNFGMELVEMIDSNINGDANFFCPDCQQAFTWDDVSEYMEN